MRSMMKGASLKFEPERRSTDGVPEAMNRVGLVILFAAIALSVAIAVLSRGHILFIGLPLLFGIPLAGVFGRR